MIRTSALGLVSALLAPAASATSQPAGLVDEATFTLTRSGAAFGVESFKIVRRHGAEGLEYVAQCTRTVDGRTVKTSLTSDSSGSPTAYSRMVSGMAPSQLTARRLMGKLTVDETGGRVSTKDFLFGPGSLILDDDLLHQLYFVTWRPRAGVVAFVAPGTRSSGDADLVELGQEVLVIGRESLPAWHFVLGAGIARRDIWIDSEKRLLKVSLPSQEIEATRAAPPR